MKTRDFMVPLKEYLKPDHTIREAVNMLRKAKRGEGKAGVKGLPVLDAQGGLLGILSMGDILRVVHPFYMSMMDLGDLTWEGMLDKLAREAGCRTVESAMTREVVTVKDDAHLMKCVDQMIRNRVHRLPVLDAAGKVVGTIHERDIFFVIVKAMLEENGCSTT
jgi:CBS domain-containing protein